MRAKSYESSYANGRFEHRKHQPRLSRFAPQPVFNMEISYQRLHALLALEETGSVRRATARLGVSRAAAYKSLHELRRLLRAGLFERAANRLRPDYFCRILARHTRLALACRVTLQTSGLL